MTGRDGFASSKTCRSHPDLIDNYSLALTLTAIALLAATLRPRKDATPDRSGLGLGLNLVQDAFRFSHGQLKMRSESKW